MGQDFLAIKGFIHPKVNSSIIDYGAKDMDEAIIIRSYEPGDRQDLLCISADTAVFGEPVEAILDDRRIFCDASNVFY